MGDFCNVKGCQATGYTMLAACQTPGVEVPESCEKAHARATVGDAPDGNPKTRFGLLKTPMHLLPVPALTSMAEVFRLGAKKYGPYNWRKDRVSASVYYAAAMRHMMAWWEGEDIDQESGQPHLAHAMDCFAIVIDAGHYDMLNDDRPNVDKTNERLANFIEGLAALNPDKPLTNLATGMARTLEAGENATERRNAVDEMNEFWKGEDVKPAPVDGYTKDVCAATQAVERDISRPRVTNWHDDSAEFPRPIKGCICSTCLARRANGVAER